MTRNLYQNHFICETFYSFFHDTVICILYRLFIYMYIYINWNFILDVDLDILNLYLAFEYSKDRMMLLQCYIEWFC